MALTLKYDFATSPTLVADTGPTLTIARASTATVTDYDNVLRTVQAAEARFSQGRRVENHVIYSEDFTDAAWTSNTGVTTTNNTMDVTDPDGGNTAGKVVYDGLDAAGANRLTNATGRTVAAGEQLINSVWLRSSSGTVPLRITNNQGGTKDITVTTTWQRFNDTVDNGNDATATIGFVRHQAGQNDAFTVYIWHPQMELVHGQDDQSPSEYQATTTAAVSKWYATKRRTNLALQSNGFDTTWVSTRCIEAQGATDPDGGSTAWTITDDSGTGTLDCYVGQSVTVANSTAYTFSFYAKADQLDWVHIRTVDFTTPGSVYSFWDLSTGATGTAGAGHTISIEDAGSGWYRCIATFTTDASDTTGNIRIGPATADTTSNVDRDGTSSTQVYGAQLEKGSTATAYIPTTTTVASSAVDTAITTTGLLVEEARTNLVTYSEDITNWTNSGTTDTSNAAGIKAPDGTETADLVDITATTAAHFVYPPAVTVVSDAVHTYSIYMRDSGVQYAGLCAFFGAAEEYITVVADLVNGTITDSEGGATLGTVVATGIEDAGNGWYRVWITGNAAKTSVILEPFSSDSGTPVYDTAGRVSYLGVDGEDFLIWGAQLEAGAFPTSYIPTTTVSVTRAADVVSTTDVSWYNQPAGTLYIAASQPYEDTGIPDVFVEIHDNSSSDRWLIYGGTVSQQLRSFIGSSAGNNAEVNATLIRSDNTLFRAVTAATNNDYELYIDGSRIGTGDQTLDMPTNFINLNVGSRYDETEQPNGHIAEIRYYNSRLDNAALLNMSNGIFPASGKPGLGLTLGKLGM